MVEEGLVHIGGIDQWISIRGEDQDNPVLFVIHGGPGSCYSIFTPHLRAWEKHFTIVQWDQRGCGQNLRPTSLAQQRRNHDEATDRRWHRDSGVSACDIYGKIRSFCWPVLWGPLSEWTSCVAARTCSTHISARIKTSGWLARGMRIIAPFWNGSVRMEWPKALRRSSESGQIRPFGATTISPLLHNGQGNPTREDFRRTIKLLKDAVWYAPGWTLRDIRAFVAGMRFSLEQLLPEIARYHAWAQGTRFELPIFIFQGENDMLTTPSIARALFDDIVAPIKQMELISGAGHFAAFQQPEKFLEKLLRYVRPLAFASSMGAVHWPES